MRCPKCGSKVRSTARFCDNCGKTLSGAEPKNNFEKYENYRREKARRQKARERREKKRRRNIKVIAVLILIAAAVCTAVFLEKKTRTGIEQSAPKESVSPTPTASATAEPAAAKPTKIPSKKKPEGIYDDISEECEFYQNKDKGIDIPYPKSMTQPGESNDKTQKSVRTEDGEAKMIISAEKIGKEMTAAQLLSVYKNGIGVEAMYSEVGDNEDFYYIDFERGGEHKHRQGILKDGYHIFYDFSYKTNSESVSKYIEYIAYIDDYVLKKAKISKNGAIDKEENDSAGTDDKDDDNSKEPDDEDGDEDDDESSQTDSSSDDEDSGGDGEDEE